MALVDFLFYWSLFIRLAILSNMYEGVPLVLANPADKLSKAIHSFIYSHEKLCGDQFEDPMWLPASNKCQLECDLLTEICQESMRTTSIKAQRCIELPKRCAVALRNTLYGLNEDISEESEEIEKEIKQFQKIADQPIQPRGVSISGTTGEQSKTPLYYNDEQRPLKPFGLDVRLIKTSGVSTLKLPTSTVRVESREDEVQEISSEEPFSTIELLQDFGVKEKTTQRPDDSSENLINEILHTSTSSFIQGYDKQANVASLEVDKNFIDKFFEEAFTDLNTLSISNSPNNKPNNMLSITLPPSPTLQYTSTTTTPGSFVTASASADIDEESTFLTSNNVLEMTSNPFESMVAQPSITISQKWNSIPYKGIENPLKVPTEIPALSPEVHIFGPPFSSSRSSPQPIMEMPSPTHRAAPLNYQARDREQMNSRADEMNFSNSRYSPISWIQLANRLKKKPFYSLEDRQEIDQSVSCCQWALDGLCDRSHQRIRAMCPKSCGSVVCSSVDGALSCSRAINVDVIDCYERRKFRPHSSNNQRLHQSSAPTRKISTVSEDSSSQERNWIEQQKGRDDKPANFAKAPQLPSSILQRAYAIENEIAAFRQHKSN